MQVKLSESKTDLRTAASQLLESGEVAGAYALLKKLWQEQPNSASARAILAKSKPIAIALPLLKCRIAFLRSFTLEPIVPLLQAAAFVQGIEVEVYLSDFNTYAQDILNPDSSLYKFQPDVVFLAVQTRDFAPSLWQHFTSLTPVDYQQAIDQAENTLVSLLTTFKTNSSANLVVHTLESPLTPSQGILDTQHSYSQQAAIATLNCNLAKTAAQHPGIYLLDYDELISRHGRFNWYDESKWLTMRMPIHADCLLHLANEWLRFLHPLTGKISKCLVVDLDNTLWGGVVGEDGIQGIQLSKEYPGVAFRQFQQVILDLYHRGVILAVCSKNNEGEALEILNNHPEMVLRANHFAAMRINWLDKAQNIREIAVELNIGLDAIAFVDDNPVERDWIRQQIPEVTVIDLPTNPLGYVTVLRQSSVFERLTLSLEDSQRGQYYAQQRQRQVLEQTTHSLEDFYYSLQMELEVNTVNAATLTRTAQLTQKTNQFNLTTQRRSEQEIADLITQNNWHLYTYHLRDRFGDNGIIGIVITHQIEDIVEIDTFLMSCRVIGRTVETALLSLTLEQARRSGANQVVGWYRPTAKNAPAQDFYKTHGFSCAQQEGKAILWSKDLSDETIGVPDWIKI